MPKSPSLPLSGLFGVVKPSGPTSMHVVNQLKKLINNSRLFVHEEKLEKTVKTRSEHLSPGLPPSGSIDFESLKTAGKKRTRRNNVKIGQGGTLDPLADGVLAIGVGKGTKRLSDFYNCTKEYRTTCLLGCETDTYDSEGARVRTAPWRHVTRDKVEDALVQFRGEIRQTPPIFSALKMDGMPLYSYARKGIPLPRPIENRPATVHSLELVEWKGSDHPYRWPENVFSAEQKKALARSLSSVQHAVTTTTASDENDNVDVAESESQAGAPDEAPTAFVLRMRVSGGTYVRSIVHDLAQSLGSAGHVVTLTRSRQKNYALEPSEEGDRGCVPWEVFEAALEDAGERDADGWMAWEREVLDKLDVLDESTSSSKP